MKPLPALAKKTVAAVACGFLLCSAVACGDSPQAETNGEVAQQDEDINRVLVYPNDLQVDDSSIDSVSKAFVEVIENHDASTDEQEWASVTRATDLMTPEAATAYTADLAGGTETQWENWRRWNAFTTAVPAFNEDARPSDTDTEAYRSVDAHIRVETPGDHASKDLVRTHFLTLNKVDGKWRVARWNVATPVEKPKENTDE